MNICLFSFLLPEGFFLLKLVLVLFLLYGFFMGKSSVQSIKKWIIQNKLQAPALLALYSLMPIANLSYHGALFSLPVLQFLLGEKNSQSVLAFLSDRKNIKELIQAVEEEN